MAHTGPRTSGGMGEGGALIQGCCGGSALQPGAFCQGQYETKGRDPESQVHDNKHPYITSHQKLFCLRKFGLDFYYLQPRVLASTPRKPYAMCFTYSTATKFKLALLDKPMKQRQGFEADVEDRWAPGRHLQLTFCLHFMGHEEVGFRLDT